MNRNSTVSVSALTDFAGRLIRFMTEELALVASSSPLASSHEAEFDLLARELFTLQFTENPAYRRLCEFRNASPADVHRWQDIPVVSTVAFKEIEITSLAPREREVVFRSSGTTESRPSRHFHSRESLEIYQSSLLTWFRANLATDVAPAPYLCLTPTPAAAPHSSLAHMFGTVIEYRGGKDSTFTGICGADGAWALDLERATSALASADSQKQPLILLGTAYNYLHLIDHLRGCGRRFTLPPGSAVLETGGYKGRSRVIPKSELHSLISEQLGVPRSQIVCEYGMSELSSQAYDRSIPQAAFSAQSSERVFHFPPWARVRIVSPENGQEVADGETGLIQVFDLANIWSVMAIQTEDLGVRRGEGFDLLGRAQNAGPRGCSLLAA
jgi:hypothetical protein